jgi:hypothetical protein
MLGDAGPRGGVARGQAVAPPGVQQQQALLDPEAWSALEGLYMKGVSFLRCSLVLVGLWLAGCDDGKKQGVQGKVCTVPNLIESVWYNEISTRDEEVPVPDAKVFLAFDLAGADPVPGCITRSDSGGFYKLDTEKVPAAKSPSGDYYLIVQKEGFALFTHPFRFGPMFGYLRNTVVLKRLPGENGNSRKETGQGTGRQKAK